LASQILPTSIFSAASLLFIAAVNQAGPNLFSAKGGYFEATYSYNLKPRKLIPEYVYTREI
jgi:hypothetical protein